MAKLTVKEYFLQNLKQDVYKGILLNWNQFNRKAENVWNRGGYMRYIGADMNENGVMFCAFKDDKSHIYCVENDVVFTYQKDFRPVVRYR